MIAVGTFTHISPWFATGCLLHVVILMLVEHIRRTKLLSLGWLPTATWIFYGLAIPVFRDLI